MIAGMTFTRSLATVAGLAAATILLGAAPAPQPAASGGVRGHDSKAPVDWTADQIEVQDKASRVLLTGNVVATQANLTLRAPRVTATYTKTSNPAGDNNVQVDRLDASGGVVVTSPSQTARGQFAVYDLPRGLITMIGDVTLTQKDSTVHGARLVYDVKSGHAVLTGGGGGASGGRVSGHFTVTQKSGSGTAPGGAKPAKPSAGGAPKGNSSAQ